MAEDFRPVFSLTARSFSTRMFHTVTQNQETTAFAGQGEGQVADAENQFIEFPSLPRKVRHCPALSCPDFSHGCRAIRGASQYLAHSVIKRRRLSSASPRR